MNDTEGQDAFALPLSAQWPGWALIAVMVAAFLLHLPRGAVMYEWAVSAQILRAGYWQNILLHMFAHAGFMHIAFNCMALASLSPHVAFRLGAGTNGWLRYLALFICCGLAGLAMFLAIHPDGDIPMLGASGAIFGFAGFLVRYPPGAPGTMPLWTRETGRALVDFVKTNLFLIAILTLPALLTGQGGGVAWEGHLGGFLFGLLAAPAFVRRPAR
ncbi:rhomboid family intramembrane serine protease [Altererythrobacter sp. CC-YST694]|uniref:rhomboid family intramembrane serine protease n=1 Tax=Altererythrobacter sp. CC-YST694 TaxID=2755038 RepID=UPI001D01CFF1|nr:rhomboid family intramembrane serine protease [Altererythrobacter sp. CC-YST694]MCB5424380.1 rhomboid family intramembrane serine protease [Altererythrobacter sp. CC-YST694]